MQYETKGDGDETKNRQDEIQVELLSDETNTKRDYTKWVETRPNKTRRGSKKIRQENEKHMSKNKSVRLEEKR